MSDYEMEEMYDSDDDQSMQSTPSSRNRSGKGSNKRDHHNDLERRRRDLIKDSFTKLRDAVPPLQGEKASRAQILKKAAEYIQTMKKRNLAHQSDTDELRKLNKILEEQIMHAQQVSK